jgi:hypothetical protein
MVLALSILKGVRDMGSGVQHFGVSADWFMV